MWASAHRGHSGGTRAERGSSLQTPKALTVRSSVLLLSTLAGEHNKPRQYDTGLLQPFHWCRDPDCLLCSVPAEVDTIFRFRSPLSPSTSEVPSFLQYSPTLRPTASVSVGSCWRSSHRYSTTTRSCRIASASTTRTSSPKSGSAAGTTRRILHLCF